MKNIKRSSTYTASLDIGQTPDSAPTVTLFHEFGDQVNGSHTTSVLTGTTYQVSLTASDTESAGVLKIKWSYNVSAVPVVKYTYLNIYSQYIDSLTFFDRHPELEEDWGDRFDEIELKVRNIINTFCGQDFDFRHSKTLTLDGNGRRTLYLPMRLESLSVASTVDSNGVGGTTTSDISDLVEITPESKFYIRLKSSSSIFGENSEVSILGDWGWPYVSPNVQDAADLIIEDWFNDDSVYRKHGVQEADIDRHRLKFSDAIFGSTGNLDADVLLMDYILFILDMI